MGLTQIKRETELALIRREQIDKRHAAEECCWPEGYVEDCPMLRHGVECAFRDNCEPFDAMREYADYLETEHWKRVSAWHKRWAGRRCQLCGCTDAPLETHHNNYDCLGRECAQDLLTLCEDCHRRFHAEKEIA